LQHLTLLELSWGDARLKHFFLAEIPANGPTLLVVERVTPGERGWLECGIRRPVHWLAASEEGMGQTMPAWVKKVRETLAKGQLVAVNSEDIRDSDGTDWPMARWLPLVLAESTASVLPVRVVPHWGHTELGVPGNWRARKEIAYHPSQVDLGWGQALPPGCTGLEVRQALNALGMNLATEREKAGMILSGPRLFLRQVKRCFDKSCFTDQSGPNGKQTFGRALTGMLLIAERLRPLLADQQMVAVWLPTGTGSGLVNGALGLMGKVSINLNYTASEKVNHACLDQTSARVVITARRFTARMPFNPGPGRQVIHLEDLLAGVTGLQKAWAFLRARFAPVAWLEKSLGISDQNSSSLATLIFSSGSTGQPKGVELTWGNLVANIQSLIQFADITPEDSILGCLPFFHSFGYTITLWAPLVQGMRVAYHPDPRQGREVGALCREEQSTVFLSTATFLRFCLRRAEAGDFSSLRYLVCGAEKLPVTLATEFRQKFDVHPTEGYGCTELSPVSNINLTNLPMPDGRTLMRDVPGSVGQPITGCAVCLEKVDSTGESSVADQAPQGMVLVGGANVMRGYWGQPARTAEVITEGYYRTGDVGYLDKNGHLVLTGRLSRFAKSGGEMVPLERVEELLHEVLPTTERACAVSCVPDSSRGERVVVLYVKATVDPLAGSVAEWVKRLTATGIPALWIPGPRDFFPVEEIPTLGSGKIDLQALKKAALLATGVTS